MTRIVSIAAALLLAGVTTSARAQGAWANSVGVSAVAVSTTHRLLAGPLVGGAAQFSQPFAGRRLMAVLGIERVSGRSHRTGLACEDFVPAGICTPEPLQDDAWLGSVSAGLMLRVLDARRLAVDVAADARAGDASSDTRGRRSGRTLHDAALLVGGDLELAAAWWPSVRAPLAIEAGIGAGGLGPMLPNKVRDGYDPIRSNFGLARLRVGLAWRTLGR